MVFVFTDGCLIFLERKGFFLNFFLTKMGKKGGGCLKWLNHVKYDLKLST